MSRASEETTKGLVADKLKEIVGYPTAQNISVDGIMWLKEDSYKSTSFDWLSGVLPLRPKSKHW